MTAETEYATAADFDGAVLLAPRVRAQDECSERASFAVRAERGGEINVGGDLAVDDGEGVAAQEVARVVEL